MEIAIRHIAHVRNLKLENNIYRRCVARRKTARGLSTFTRNFSTCSRDRGRLETGFEFPHETLQRRWWAGGKKQQVFGGASLLDAFRFNCRLLVYSRSTDIRPDMKLFTITMSPPFTVPVVLTTHVAVFAFVLGRSQPFVFDQCDRRYTNLTAQECVGKLILDTVANASEDPMNYFRMNVSPPTRHRLRTTGDGGRAHKKITLQLLLNYRTPKKRFFIVWARINLQLIDF